METTLRHFGNSVGLVVPKSLRLSLHFTAGQRVILEPANEGFVVKPAHTKRYTLEELVSQCDPKASVSIMERLAWDQSPAAGNEIW